MKSLCVFFTLLVLIMLGCKSNDATSAQTTITLSIGETQTISLASDNGNITASVKIDSITDKRCSEAVCQLIYAILQPVKVYISVRKNSSTATDTVSLLQNFCVRGELSPSYLIDEKQVYTVEGISFVMTNITAVDDLVDNKYAVTLTTVK